MTEMVGKRHLGRSAIEITPIGLGAWQFSEGRGGARGSWSRLAVEETDAIIQASLDGGINWFDTAELYGFGRSEKGLARGLRLAGKTDGEVVIATKWNPLFRTAGSIKKTIGERQRCLEPFSIDLHQIHFPASFSSTEAEMNAMADLVERGAIRAVGVSNFGVRRMRRASDTLSQRGLFLASNQVKYSLLDRCIESDGVLTAARELGITLIAYSPLEMGLLTGKFHKDPHLLSSRPFGRRVRLRRQIEKSRRLILVLEEIAAGHGASVAQVALSWLVRFHGATVVTIPGATTVRQAQENAEAMRLMLTDEEMARIDETSREFL